MMTKNIAVIDVYDVGPQLEWVIVLRFHLVPFFDQGAWCANFSKAY